MYLSRIKIREFLDFVEWACPRHFVIIKNGAYTNKKTLPILVELARMARLGFVKRLNHKRSEAVYATTDCKRYDVGSGNKFDHDSNLRDCIARFLHDHLGYEVRIKNDKNADALVEKEGSCIYFEMDRGNEDEEQIKKKFSNYSDKGNYRVIFFMATRYSTDNEHKRLEKLFELIGKLMYKKPNRIIGACYSQYLRDGKIYNLRGEPVNDL